MNNARDTTRKDSIGRMGSTNQNGGRSSYLMDAIHHLAGNRYIVYRLGRPAANLVPRSLVAEKKVKKNEDKTNRTKKKPKRKWRRRRVTFVENLSRNVAGAWRRLLNNGCRERERENKKKSVGRRRRDWPDRSAPLSLRTFDRAPLIGCLRGLPGFTEFFFTRFGGFL